MTSHVPATDTLNSVVKSALSYAVIFLPPSTLPIPFDPVLLLSQGWSQTPSLSASARITVMLHHVHLVSASFSFLFSSPPTFLWH